MMALCSCTKVNDLPLSQEFQYGVYQHHFAEYGSGTAHLISVWFVMILLGAVFTILTMLALRAVDKDRR